MFRVRTAITGGNSGPYLSTLYFNVIGGLTAADANAATGVFWNAIKGKISNTLTISTEAEVASLDVVTGQVTGLTPVTPVVTVGTVAGEIAPPASQGLLRWRTGTYIEGREIRGRMFIPGVTETDSQSGKPSSTYISVINAAAAALIADVSTDLLTWSKKNGESAPTVSGSVWSEFAVLRSRRS